LLLTNSFTCPAGPRRSRAKATRRGSVRRFITWATKQFKGQRSHSLHGERPETDRLLSHGWIKEGEVAILHFYCPKRVNSAKRVDGGFTIGLCQRRPRVLPLPSAAKTMCTGDVVSSLQFEIPPHFPRHGLHDSTAGQPECSGCRNVMEKTLHSNHRRLPLNNGNLLHPKIKTTRVRHVGFHHQPVIFTGLAGTICRRA